MLSPMYSHSAICSRGSFLEVIPSTKRCPTTLASLPDYECDALPRPLKFDGIGVECDLNLNEKSLTLQTGLDVLAMYKL